MWRQRASGRRWVLATPLSTWTTDWSWEEKTTAGGNAHCPLYLPLFLFFWQTLLKMAYHSPYRAPPHINAPPDQGFLWNIFQRWVGKGRVASPLSARPASHSAPHWQPKLPSVARRGRRDWDRVVPLTHNVQLTARFFAFSVMFYDFIFYF